jgi:flagellar basal-body rod modification protein FlgD
MATSPISPSGAAANGVNLQLNDLLRVLLTELTHQDPFKPVDNKDFITQIGQFAALDTNQQINQNIQQLLVLQALSQSVGLIGRQVTATTSNGTQIDGTVIALSTSTGVPRLSIRSSDVGGAVFTDIAIGQLLSVR